MQQRLARGLHRAHVMTGRRTRDEGGWAIVTAMMVMTAMLIIGLATVAFVDGESRSSAHERQSEARLNLTEGALSTELYQLSHAWPTSAASGFTDCTPTATATTCFTPAQLKANFNQVDLTKLGTDWKVQVRDDVLPAGTPATATCDPSTSNMSGYYNDAQILTQPNYDANGNCQLWVRAEGTLNGVKRVLVAKVRVDTRPVQFPIAPFVSGSFNTGNNAGKKVIVDGGGQIGQVRCTSTASSCVDYNGAQVSNPGTVSTGDPNLGNSVLDPAMVDALRKTAQQNGTYYSSTTAGKTSCPNDPSGAVVFIEDLSCLYSGNLTVNPTTKQGIFIVNRGTLKITGSGDWYGAIYMVNAQNCGPSQTSGCLNNAGYSDIVMQMSGTATVHGGIFVDGTGRLSLGSSGNSGGGQANLIYDPTVFPPMQAYGTAGIIQNTWREITAG
jgi:Tfp pilus assembly protein PilX